MGLFGKIFGVDMKLQVARDCMAILLRDQGLSEREIIGTLKRMRKASVMGTPVAGIVVNIETIVKSQASGTLLHHILPHIENHRKCLMGSDENRFREILGYIQAAPNRAVWEYVLYRHDVESAEALSEEQFDRIFEYASREFWRDTLLGKKD